jgi:hypothetical protein
VEILIFNLKSGCYAVGDMAKDRKKAAAPEPPIMSAKSGFEKVHSASGVRLFGRSDCRSTRF